MTDRRKPPQNVNVIQKWVAVHARQHGVAPNRLTRWIQFMIVAAALDRARSETDAPLFLIKGGAAMELRLRLDARATKDLDAIYGEPMETMLDRLDQALRPAYGDFTFGRTQPELFGETPTVRIEVRLSYRDRRWHRTTRNLADRRPSRRGSRTSRRH